MNVKAENLPNFMISKYLIKKKFLIKVVGIVRKHRTDSKLSLSFPNRCIYEVILKDRN